MGRMGRPPLGPRARTELIAFRVTKKQLQALATLGPPSAVAHKLVTRWLGDDDEITPGEDPLEGK